MELTKLERYFLSNQLRILEALYPQEADEYAKKREILESGYEYLYDSGMEYIYEGRDVMSVEECKEVWNTLDMFEGIDRSLENLGRQHDNPSRTKFRGYDGNSESKFMGFAEFTINRERRWTYLPLAEENYFNSHMQLREVYGRMLVEYQQIPHAERYSMSAELLERVIGAAVHPDNR